MAEGSSAVTASEQAVRRSRLAIDTDGLQRRRPRVSVVIPALNEAKNIPHVLATLPDGLFEVVLVDGGSTDGTVDVARSARPDVRIVRQPGTGKGDALAAGIAACRGEAVVLFDADGSADGAEIPRFVDALVQGADLAKGSRFLDDGGSSDISLLRRAGNRFLCSLVNLLFGTRYTDLCYGFNAAWRASLSRLSLDCGGFEVETLLNIRSAKAGLDVREVPSFEARRLYGRSNLRPVRDGLRVLRTILRERFTGPRARTDVLGSFAEQPQVASEFQGSLFTEFSDDRGQLPAEAT
jgi:glycosyltransferase involved in cell wall biosynthesis